MIQVHKDHELLINTQIGHKVQEAIWEYVGYGFQDNNYIWETMLSYIFEFSSDARISLRNQIVCLEA